ncbi:MAG: 50S ribosomal protein L3 [Armatimonadetes bacterium]|nr:50S ribosomal protein L3 [Armatimonadota bacterium]
MKGLIGKKIGMTQIFGNKGEVLPVTVIQAGPCVVSQKKIKDLDGYTAVQLGYEFVKDKKINSPETGHFKKNKLKPMKYLREFIVKDIEKYQIGQEIKVDIFKAGELVDVSGVSKGKSFAGGMKRHGFSGGGASHGSMIHRQPASGGSTDAARTYKGKRGPGHLGNAKRTVSDLEIVKIDQEKNLLLVKGSIPGSNGRLVLIRGLDSK